MSLKSWMLRWRERRAPKSDHQEPILPPVLPTVFSGLPGLEQYQTDSLAWAGQADMALMLIDINSFADIVMIFGQEMAQRMLKRSAEILEKTCTDQGDLYCLGQGEFVLVCRRARYNKLVHLISQVIFTLGRENHKVNDRSVLLNATAGIIIDIMDGMQSLLWARQTRDQARALRRDWLIRRLEPDLAKIHQQNLHVLSLVRQALEDRQIEPHYQPILDLYRRQIIGCEALVRLRDREGHLHAPGSFLDITRHSTLYRQLTLTMIRRVLTEASRGPLMVALNMDAVDIHDEELMTILLDEVRHNGLSGRIVVELSEADYVLDLETIGTVAQQLKAEGIRLAIDDVRIGHGILDVVGQIPIAYLKVDGSLIQRLLHDRSAYAQVRALASFALEMSLPLVAEHVSDESVLKTLRRLNFRYAQGFCIGEPMSFDDACALYQQSREDILLNQ